MSTVEDRVRKIVVEQLGVKEEDLKKSKTTIEEDLLSMQNGAQAASFWGLLLAFSPPQPACCEQTRGLIPEIPAYLVIP